MKSLHVFSSHATTMRDVNAPEPPSKRYAEYFADEVRAEMSRKMINNRELARRIDALGESRSEPTISRLLRGTQRMSVDDAWLFAEAVGVDVQTLSRRAAERRDAEGGALPDVQRLTSREEPDSGEH